MSQWEQRITVLDLQKAKYRQWGNVRYFKPLIVLPHDDDVNHNTILPNHDFVQTMQQWEIEQEELGKVTPGTYTPNKFGRNPNFFTLNGNSFLNTESLQISYGEKIRIRFINKSNSNHSMHIYGHNFKIISVDGFPRKNLLDDTIIIGSGKRFDVEFIANNPGIWPINGTRNFHQSNNGETPGGMVNRLVYIRSH
ncbi:multicopper oxidase domain-containing protein [Bacillaceae bacterium S4-13-58]